MAIFYGKSNLNFTQAGIKWNIKRIASKSQLPVNGKPGEVYILTDKNINKIKKVATIFEGDDLVDNAINLFYQESTDSKRINDYWGWKFDFKFNSQTTLLNGKLIPTYVYFWDMNVNDWVEIQVSYNFNEKVKTMEFMSKNLNIENLYPDLGITNYEFNVNNILLLENIVIPAIVENINTLEFMGADINMTNIYPNLYVFTEELTHNG